MSLTVFANKVCNRCLSTKRVSSAVLSIERDSMISVGHRHSEEDGDNSDEEEEGLH